MRSDFMRVVQVWARHTWWLLSGAMLGFSNTAVPIPQGLKGVYNRRGVDRSVPYSIAHTWDGLRTIVPQAA